MPCGRFEIEDKELILQRSPLDTSLDSSIPRLFTTKEEARQHYFYNVEISLNDDKE